MKAKLDNYRKGDAFIISITAYAKLKNKFIKQANLHKKHLYKKDDVEKHKSQGKRTRVVVVLWNSEYSNNILVCPESTYKDQKLSENDPRTMVSIGNRKFLLYPYALKIDKNKIKMQNKDKHPYKYYSSKEIDRYLKKWMKTRSKSYNYYLNNYLRPLQMETDYKKKLEKLRNSKNREEEMER